MTQIIKQWSAVLLIIFCLQTVIGYSAMPQSEQKIAAKKEALIGVWQAEDNKDVMVRFQNDKFSIVRNGLLQFMLPVVAYNDEGMVLCLSTVGGKPSALFKINLIDQALKINYSEDPFLSYINSATFHKVPDLPSVFEPSPLPIKKPATLDQAYIKQVTEQLLSRAKFRAELVTKYWLSENGDRTTGNRLIGKADIDDTAYLKKIISEVGWIDKQRFGNEVSVKAFLIVQHSGDIPLMMTALPELERDNSLISYALLYDRLNLYLGHKQRFGSQISNEGVLPLEEPSSVDERRSKMGLDPLGEYIKKAGLKEMHILEACH